MGDITVEIIGDRRIEEKLDHLTDNTRQKLRPEVDALVNELRSRVVAAAPRDKGTLASKISSAVSDNDKGVIGRVFVTGDFGKAAALEYGAHGSTTVKAHEAQLNHVFGRLTAPLTVMVAEHSRHINIAEHRYLRGSLAGMQSEATSRLRAAVEDAVAVSQAQ